MIGISCSRASAKCVTAWGSAKSTQRGVAMIQRREVVFGLAGVALANSLMGRSAFAAGKIKPTSASALIVVDVQNCFLPGGSVAVKDGDQVVPVINRIAKAFSNVVLTQDWHTAHHVS